MKQTVEIKYMDIILSLEGYYSKGEDDDLVYPGHHGYPSEFDTHEVYVNGVDIVNILSDDTLEELDKLAIEKIEG